MPNEAKHDPEVIRALVGRVRAGDADLATHLATRLRERLGARKQQALVALFDVLHGCYPDDPQSAGIHRRYSRDKIADAATRLEAGSPSAQDHLALAAMQGDALRTLGHSAETWLVAVGSFHRDV